MEILTFSSFGGREESLKNQATNEAKRLAADGKEMANDAKAGAETIANQAKEKAGELKAKVVR